MRGRSEIGMYRAMRSRWFRDTSLTYVRVFPDDDDERTYDITAKHLNWPSDTETTSVDPRVSDRGPSAILHCRSGSATPRPSAPRIVPTAGCVADDEHAIGDLQPLPLDSWCACLEAVPLKHE